MYHLALYVHFVALIFAFFATGLLVAGVAQVRRARMVTEARAAVAQQAAASKMHPIAIVLLLASGAYMTQTQWSWQTPWIDCGIAGLVVVSILGGAVLGGRERALHRFLEQTPDGAIAPDLRERLNDKVANIGGPTVSCLVLAIMLLMVMKPDVTGGIVTLLGGVILGIAVGVATLPPEEPVAAEAAAEA